MNEERLPIALGFLAALALGFAALHWNVLQPADLGLLDAEFRLLREIRPQPVSRDVALVAVDESTFREFREPFSLWHPHLGKFLKAMALAKPAVVGLDIVLPDKSYDFLIPGYDRPLLEGLGALRGVAAVVLAQSLDEHGNQRRLFAPYVSLAGADSLGSIAICRDADGMIRRFDEALCADAGSEATLAGRMAAHLGIEQHWSGYIDYAAGDPVSYVPLQQVLQWLDQNDQQRLASAFAGKPVLLGVALPYSDRHPLPVALAAFEPESRLLPGVLVHVQALRSMMHRGLVQPLPAWGVYLLALGALALWLGRSSAAKAAVALAVVIGAPAASLLLLWKGSEIPGASLGLLAALAFLARLAYDARGQLRERRFLRDAFGSYVSPQILKEILRGRIRPGVAGKRERICVLFCRLQDFSARARQLEPEETVALLNECFSAATEAIYRHGGTTNKFLGDAVVALFGAPQILANPAKSALEAAQDMLEGLAAVNARLLAQGKLPVSAGIGIHCGEAVLGHVGGRAHQEYTAIGDAVSVASRLQSLSAELRYPVICSADVANSVGRAGGLADLGMKPLRGYAALQLFGWQPPALAAHPAVTPLQATP